jgi:hypothetical protein
VTAPSSPLPPGGVGGGQDHLDINLPSVWFDDDTRNQRAAAYLAQRDANNNNAGEEDPVLFELSGAPLAIAVIIFALAMILIATLKG